MTRAARRLRRVGGVVLFAALVLLCLELVLRSASFFVIDRAAAWRAGARVHVLSVGDSHTYGSLVPADQSYPAQLQVLLDEHEAGHYSVVNVGLPGMSTTQVRNRLAVNLARYEPDLVILWCGINNIWNVAELSERVGGARLRVEGLLQRLRAYRMLRVWLHDRELEQVAGAVRGRVDGVHQRVTGFKSADERQTWTLSHGERKEVVVHEEVPKRIDAAMQERTYADLKAIVALLRAAAVPLVMIQYPLKDGASFDAVNRIVRRVAEEESIAVVDASSSLERVPEADRKWLWGRHPNGRIYGEIARDVAAAVLSVASGITPNHEAP